MLDCMRFIDTKNSPVEEEVAIGLTLQGTVRICNKSSMPPSFTYPNLYRYKDLFIYRFIDNLNVGFDIYFV